VPTSHPHQVFDAISHPDKELVELPGANHYFSGAGQKTHLTRAADLVHHWVVRHQFVN